MIRKLSCFVVLAAWAVQASSQISPLDALKLASQNRPSLLAARLRVDEAKATARSLSSAPPLELALGASSRSDLGATDQDLALTQEIDLFGKVRSAKGLGSAAIRRAEALYREEASALQTEVLTAFSDATFAERQTQVAGELLKLAQAVFTATKQRFEEGHVAEMQVTRAQIELERARQANELSQAELQVALTRLSGFVGLEATQLKLEPQAEFAPLSDAALDQRPDLLVYKAEVLVAEAEAQASRTSQRPEFRVQVVRSPWSNERGVFVGRAQLTWSIFDHGRARNESKAALLRAEAARKSLLDATLQAQKEWESAKVEIAARKARTLALEGILSSARDLVGKAQIGFKEGFGTLLDVLEATRALREVEQELSEAHRQFDMAVISQYQAAGFLVEVLK